MSESVDSSILNASAFIKRQFGIELLKTQLKQYCPENWRQFCRTNNFDDSTEGLFVPASYSAYVKADSPVLTSNIFHELYGHGLFCEHSQIGRTLVEIIQDNKDEKAYLFNDINPQEQPLGLCRTNICNYEGFAVWLEALLCEETGNSEVWRMRKDKLPPAYIRLLEHFQDTERKMTRFGLMCQIGFPKFYDENQIIQTLKLLDSAFFNIEFVILYGSQKPASDIDLFIISKNQSTKYFNGWLDIYKVRREEFAELSSKLDISITDPLFSGKLIYGDNNEFEQLKQQILNQPITEEAINHNAASHEKQKEYLPQFQDDKRRKDCLGYVQSFSQNAKQLSLGNKPLTLRNLEQIKETSLPT